MKALLFLSLLSVPVASASSGQCVHGQRGPKCSSDVDCKDISACVRCAHSGYCTDIPLPGPGPAPGPTPAPSPGQCVHGRRGPKCSSDVDCKDISACVRCAHSGYCTDIPLPGPGPAPGPGPHPAEGCTPGNNNYDYLMLVQGWPNSMSMQKKVPGAYASLDYWTLHGLWPSRNGSTASTYPCKCDRRPYDKSQVASIREDLQKYWPSYNGDDSFWDHEWTKHGTCASDIATLSKELSFFNKTLELRQAHDIGAALKKASIVPDTSNAYTAEQLTSALTPINGFKPLLGCIQKQGTQYLHEVSFCLDKNLKDIDCDNSIRVLPHDEVSDCDLSTQMVLIKPAAPATILDVVV